MSKEFAALFEGYQDALGVYSLVKTETDGSGKIVGKAATLKRPVVSEDWERHLAGEVGLGIIPINGDSQVKFAAIDVDLYPLDLAELSAKIHRSKFPLVLCRTKSGGAHLYLFLTDWVDASIVRRAMQAMAASLGVGGSEIFPKQSKVLVERGDIGQWINLPYFKAIGTQRYGLDARHKVLPCDEFILYCESKRVTKEVVESIKLDIKEELPGGPPCLNLLVMKGFPPGTRNNGLFNLGVYARKATPDAWQKSLEDFNNRYMDPPLDAREVLGVMKSLQKKEFNYMCQQPPIKQFCDQARCRGCEFGVGGGIGMPSFGTLTKVKTDPPVWFLEVEGGGRLELTTDELQSPRAFQLRCMSTLNIMPQLPKMEVWTGIVQRLLGECQVVEIPKDGTPQGQLLQHLEEFCTSRVQGKSHDELVLGKPWTNNGYHYFRMRDFIAYLDRQKFRDFKLNQIMFVLQQDAKLQHKFFNVKGKGVNCYMVPEFKNAVQTEPLETPDQESAVPM